ncbi:MAG TPA: tripartite tricarboxylate transporter TctB family protein [Luteitalea sp.]|nr:tripartite tricarboxylate transporter TctB family protein [Luteitalea sp.]
MSGARVVAFVMAVGSLAIVATTLAWPGGNAGVPGPALVPRLLGVALLLVALVLVRTPGTSAPPMVRHHLAVPATMLLLAVYAAGWRVVPFGVLTAAVLLTFFRLTGTRWTVALPTAVGMAVTLQLLFERGLGVRF